MRILVTGSSGFLGTALCARLAAEGHDVTALGSRQCDLTRQDALRPWNDCRFDRIYHLAAWTQAGDFCLRHPAEQWVKNQQINTQVLAWWQERQPQAKLVAMGTSCAYAPGSELVEENYLDGPPIESLFTYAMTKRMLYVGLLAMARQYGLTHLCLVPSTLYGPGYHSDGRQMHFIFDLIRKILRGKLLGEPVVLWGDGHQSRELVYIDDFVEAAVQLADSADDELINIGAGSEHSIRHFAELICRKVGYDFGQIRYDASRYVGARSKRLDVEKLRRFLPGFQRTPLEKGLEKTIDWFRERAFNAAPDDAAVMAKVGKTPSAGVAEGFSHHASPQGAA